MFTDLFMKVRGRAGEPPAGSLSLDADSIKPIATQKKLSSGSGRPRDREHTQRLSIISRKVSKKGLFYFFYIISA